MFLNIYVLEKMAVEEVWVVRLRVIFFALCLRSCISTFASLCPVTSYCLVLLLHVPVHFQLTGTTCASTYYILTGTTRASTHHSIYWQVLRVRVWCRQHGLPLDIHGPLRLWRLGLQSRPGEEKRRLSMLSSKTILSMYYIGKNSSKRTSICHHFHGLSCLCVGPRVFFNIFLYFTLTEQRRGLWAQHGRCKGAFFSGQALWIPESSSLLNKCQV